MFLMLFFALLFGHYSINFPGNYKLVRLNDSRVGAKNDLSNRKWKSNRMICSKSKLNFYWSAEVAPPHSWLQRIDKASHPLANVHNG